MVRVLEGRRRLSCAHRNRCKNLRWIPFSYFSDRYLPGYITFQTTTQILMVTHPISTHLNVACEHSSIWHAPCANSRGHTTNLPPTQCTWSDFLLACHPRNLRGISVENNCILFTLGTGSISCYFRSTRVRLPLLHRQMSKGHLSQYLAILHTNGLSTPTVHFTSLFTKHINSLKMFRQIQN